MASCTQCGTALDPSMRFCGVCGKPVQALTAAPVGYATTSAPPPSNGHPLAPESLIPGAAFGSRPSAAREGIAPPALGGTWKAGGSGPRRPPWMVAVIAGLVVALLVTAGLAFVQMGNLAKTRKDLLATRQTLATTQDDLTNTQQKLSDSSNRLALTEANLSSAQSELNGSQVFASACQSAFGASKEAMADVLKATQSDQSGDYSSGLFWLQQALAAIKRAQPDITRCNSGP